MVLDVAVVSYLNPILRFLNILRISIRHLMTGALFYSLDIAETFHWKIVVDMDLDADFDHLDLKKKKAVLTMNSCNNSTSRSSRVWYLTEC